MGEMIMVEGELSEIEEILEPKCIACVGLTYNVKVNSGPTKTKRFVRYLTGSWAKASSYTWSKSNSASSTVSSDLGLSASGVSSKLGVSNSVTTTYSVAINIPADKKRNSKLGFYSDYNKRNVTVTTKMQGKVVSTKKGDHFAPRKDTYLQVVYQ